MRHGQQKKNKDGNPSEKGLLLATLKQLIVQLVDLSKDVARIEVTDELNVIIRMKSELLSHIYDTKKFRNVFEQLRVSIIEERKRNKLYVPPETEQQTEPEVFMDEEIIQQATQPIPPEANDEQPTESTDNPDHTGFMPL